MRNIAVILAVLLVLAGATAHAVEVSVKPLYWSPDLDTRMRVGQNNIGDEIDLASDLGMDDEDIYGATIDLGLTRSSHVILSYWTVDYSGDEVISRDLRYDGRSYVAGSRVRSDFDIDAYELGYAFDLINLESFCAGLLLQLNAFVIDSELRSNLLPIPNEEDFNLLYPLPGIQFGFRFLDNKAAVAGKFGGLWWQGSGWWDGSAELAIYPIKNLGVSAGYRFMHYDISDDDDRYQFHAGRFYCFRRPPFLESHTPRREVNYADG